MPLPPELERLKTEFRLPVVNPSTHNHNGHHDTESDEGEEMEDAVGESDQESEADEDLQLEVDDAHNTSKVSAMKFHLKQFCYNFFVFNFRTIWKLNIWQH